MVKVLDDKIKDFKNISNTQKRTPLIIWLTWYRFTFMFFYIRLSSQKMLVYACIYKDYCRLISKSVFLLNFWKIKAIKPYEYFLKKKKTSWIMKFAMSVIENWFKYGQGIGIPTKRFWNIFWTPHSVWASWNRTTNIYLMLDFLVKKTYFFLA